MHVILFFPVEPGAPGNPLSIVFDILKFLGALLGLGSSDIKVLSQAINNTWQNLVFSSAFLYNAVGYFTDFIKKFLGTLLDGLKHILLDLLHGKLKKVIQDIIDLLHKLHDLVAPLIAVLRRLQAIQRKLQLEALGRVINLIQRVRSILALLRILHVKWAQRLDNWLAGIEGKLIAREWDIMRKTNEIINWVNWILDPTAFFRAVPMWGTLARDLGALGRALQALGLGNLYPAAARGANHPAPAVHFTDWASGVLPTMKASTPAYDEFAAGVITMQDRFRNEVGT